MQRMLDVVLASGTLCSLLGLLTLTGCNRPAAVAASASAKTNEATPVSESKLDVTVMHAVRKTLTRTTAQPGRIEAFEQTPIYARIEGYVRKARTVMDGSGKPVERELADMGDRVEANEVLAEIAVPEMDAELKQKLAQAALAKAAITRAEGEYQRWKAERERIGQLADGGSVSRKLMDEAQYQFVAAEASRQVAMAQLQVAEADADRLSALLAYAKIRAPFAGVITERNVDTGHLVRPAQGGTTRPLFVVTRTDRVRVFTEVPPVDAPLVDCDDVALVRIPDLDGAEFTDKVKCTSWSLDRVSRTLRTEIDLPSDNGRLKPGMYVNVQIVLARRENVPTLPVTSIFREGNQNYCWCIEGGKACRKSITLGLRVDGDVEVVSGLSEDEPVVGSSATPLKQGQVVTIGAS